MTIPKFKKFYVIALFKFNQAIEANIINVFKHNFNIPLNLSKNEISKEKTKAIANYKNMELLELWKNIVTNEFKVNINAIDIFYEYEKKHKKIKEKRQEKVLFIITDKMKEDFKKKDTKRWPYFIENIIEIDDKSLKKNFIMEQLELVHWKSSFKIFLFIIISLYIFLKLIICYVKFFFF